MALKTKKNKNEAVAGEQKVKEQKPRQIVTIDTYDRISRRLRITQITSALLAVAMLTFLCLFVYQLGAEKRSYQKVYYESADRAAVLMTELSADPFDYDMKYREITAELGTMCQMTYLMKAGDQQQKAVNEIYYAYIKLPNQVKANFGQLQEQLVHIRERNEETVYDDLRSLIAGFDKLDY